MAHSTKLIFCLLLVAWATCVLAEEILSADDRFKGEVNSNEHKNVKRAVNVRKRFMADDQVVEMLELHNDKRHQESATLGDLVWNSDLEYSAQEVADTCRYENSDENTRKNAHGFKYVGENLGFSSDVYNATAVVERWYKEKEDYNFKKTVL